MRLLSFLLLSIFLQFPLLAQTLSMENIALNIEKSLPTHLKGKNRAIVQNIYKQTSYKPLWIGEQNKKKMSQLVQALSDPMFNYKDKSFDQKTIARLFFMLDSGEISKSKQAAVYARLDLILSNSMVRLVRFIVQGDVDWNLVQKKFKALKSSDDIKATWEMSTKAFPSEEALYSAVSSGSIYPYLKSLIPMKKRYMDLVSLLKDYRIMEKFPKIAYTKRALKLGNRNTHVTEVKKRLLISGDFPKGASLNSTFDKTLQKAVITYQKRYLLKITGTVDRTMVYYLNQSVKKNIQAIITNLDKTKLYPKSFEKEHVEVNIPDFNLRYYRGGKKIMKMGIVVGRIDRPTPLFQDRIEYMVVNPTWTIPNNLIKRDLIHVLRENPSYLEENNIHVFSGKKEIQITQAMLDPYENNKKHVPYRFVQFPGDNNALGRIKFMFPNKYAVYLHDTDNKTLLTRRYKVYSSGCMRVDKPFKLMDTLLASSSKRYSKSQIEDMIATDKPTTIKLRKSIPVHMLYFTVYKEDGLAYFKNDIYMYDQIIEESILGRQKATFKVPEKRLISIKKQAQALTLPQKR
ncbi:MAG: L,D-transpeptidase family protein [Campylobacterota bacterium]|nr:L,D-transpeptidase family protein [Campylobacterota bacterium]